MAVTKGAKKAHRASLRKYVFNLRRKRAMTSAVKEARVFAGKDHAAQAEALRAAYQAIDKAQKRGVIKKNTAARKKARLAAFLKKTAH